jgi:hypothetical protein
MGAGSRLATTILEHLGERLWGFRPRLMKHIVRDRGAFGSLVWFVTNMPGYERALAAEGVLRTNLRCTAISIENGCADCAYGPGLDLQLVFVRDHGRVFALDEGPPLALVATDTERR